MPNNTNTKITRLWARFRDKLFRDAFVESEISATIAAQIATMRKDRDWTQSDLANATGMAQSRISLLEDPSYDRMSITTLKRIASAFDVALAVRFVPFSEILRRAADDSEGRLSVASFAQDAGPAMPDQEWSAFATVHIGYSSDPITQTAPDAGQGYRITIPRNEDAISAHIH